MIVTILIFWCNNSIICASSWSVLIDFLFFMGDIFLLLRLPGSFFIVNITFLDTGYFCIPKNIL